MYRYVDDEYGYGVFSNRIGDRTMYAPMKMRLDAKVMHAGTLTTLGGLHDTKDAAIAYLDAYAEEHCLRKEIKEIEAQMEKGETL